MVRKFVLTAAALACLILLSAAPITAQEGPPLPGELIMGDIGAPRGIAFDADGNLLVADAGSGGDFETVITGPEGEVMANLGMSGRVISISPDGDASDLIGGMPSYNFNTETVGLYRAITAGDSLWVIFNGNGPSTFGAYWTNTIAEIDRATLSTIRTINLDNFELVNDPDGNGYDSNVVDLAWTDDGTLLIADSGGNSLLSWTEDDGLELVVAWPDNPVPTSVDVAENGDIYVGFLGAGLAPGAAKIERWSGGELVETFAGLNAVTDILIDGDNIYAVELVLFGDEGPGPGRVISVTAEGSEPIVEGLPAPFGIAMGPDGALYVSFGTIPLGPGITGGVLRVPM